MSINQRSSDMESLYESDPDPWKNRERGLYDVLMKEVVERVLKHRPKENNIYLWCDMGCGGGNVMDGVRKAMEENGKLVVFRGTDISPSALDWLKANEYCGDFRQLDFETYKHGDLDKPVWGFVDVISWIEVLYYLGDKRDWRDSFAEIWKSVAPGTLIVVADTLIPYQYRDHLKKFKDAELLESYTDYSLPVSVEERSDGRSITRWFKVRIYRKRSILNDQVNH